jgi:7-cyano-7-deazaguanine synthase
MHNKRSIVLVSGGLDSCLTAAVAQQQGYEMAFLHVNYGQRTELRELKAFKDIANHYKVSQQLVADIRYLKAIGGSSLVDRNMPIEQHQQLPGTTIPSTYVPFRNTHLLAIATSWAETIQAGTIFIGAVEETQITIKTPIITLRKKDIVLKAITLKAPLHLTWSCYEKSRKACGVCDSCMLRLRGFKEAGAEDPIPYVSVR